MQESKTRDKVLKKIRQAMIRKQPVPASPDPDVDSDIYVRTDETPSALFMRTFTLAGGTLITCGTELDFLEQLTDIAGKKRWTNILCFEEKAKALLDSCEFPYAGKEEEFTRPAVAITLCESLVARTGSVMLSSKQTSGRRLPVFPDAHLVLGYTSQIVPDIKDALQALRTKYGPRIPSMITLATGPSRTADIEKILVKGAHGPKEIYVFLVDDTLQSKRSG